MTQGLTKPFIDGDLDMIYIIESPMKQIDFTGIINDECKFSTTIHVDSIGSGLTLDSRGLTHTDTVFEADPPAYPLETFRIQQDGLGTTIGDGYLNLFTDNYSFDEDIVDIIVVIESLDSLDPETYQF